MVKMISKSMVRNVSHVCNLKPYKDTKWLMPNGNPTGLYIYNCVANEKVPIILSDQHIATWYSCGPTVYDSAHIGHASCYVKLDIIQRVLKSFFKINLITVMGVTDIDDKIINKANDTKTDFKAIAKKYEHEFWLDMTSLNVEKPSIVTKVSDHIPAIESFIKYLVDCEKAYIASDGSVYFDTGKHEHYGKLHNVTYSNELRSKDKRNDMDFALWKGHKPSEPSWNVLWGAGRPGWHIECSAMVSKVFGSQLDFHAGGIDLRFPHHENEEAQSCSFHNIRQWANYWVHVGHLHVKGDFKMSKSLQNTISIPSMLESYSSDVFRMACLMSHYRYPMEYSNEVMHTAEEVLKKFKHFLRDAHTYVNDPTKDSGTYSDRLLDELQSSEDIVREALKDDIDTSTCINNLLTLIANTNRLIKSDIKGYYPIPVILTSEHIVRVLKKFGLQLDDAVNENISNSVIDTLVEFRQSVRSTALSSKQQDLLNACDIVRDKLKAMKVHINDKGTESTWITSK